MKISRDKIKQLVKEEISKNNVIKEQPEQRQKADVQRLGQKLERTAGLDRLLSNITDRVEFEQFIKNVIRISSKKLKHNDIILGINNIKRALDREKK
jgi:hypothetical protein